jgi:prepilin-type N-terminal cleavage/methylation domain-containing protein
MDMSQRRGFSLLEVMIVLVVAGIVMGFGLPTFSGYREELHLVQARAHLAEDVRLARQLAVTQRCPVYIRFGELPGGSDIRAYEVLVDRDGTGRFDAGERRWQRSLPRDVRLASVGATPVAMLAFGASGRLARTSEGVTPGGTFVFRNVRNRRDTLVVDASGTVEQR